MALTLDDLKKQFADSDNKSTFNNADWYRFWNMDFDQVVTFRFLPDGDPKASHFLVEKWLHRLEVNIDGKNEVRNVPCLQMYGKRCPVCDTAKKFYDNGDDDNGSRFYKKRSWIGQGIVVDSPFTYDEPENQPKLISVGWQVYSSIKSAIMQGDVEAMPTDLENGYNYRITKTRGAGGKAGYTNSRFSPKASAVDPALMENITLHVLKDKLPREPDLANVEAMLDSALTGVAYTPPGKKESGAFDKATATTPPSPEASAPVVEQQEESATSDFPKAADNDGIVDGSDEADQILAAIAARRDSRQNS